MFPSWMFRLQRMLSPWLLSAKETDTGGHGTEEAETHWWETMVLSEHLVSMNTLTDWQIL